MGKAAIFSEALPFIRRFRGTTVVIKYGGSAMVDENLRNTFADDVAMLHYVGINPVIVHGGGPHISQAMGQRGIEQGDVRSHLEAAGGAVERDGFGEFERTRGEGDPADA